ncbi:MAG: translocation/assembly module TamB domain-containing protein [Polyangiaceae bacterium]
MVKQHERKKRGVLRWILRIAGGVILVPVCLIVLALLSLQLAPVRNLVRGKVEGILQSTFAGKIAIERLDRLSLFGLGGARVRIEDPSGTQVLLVDDASVRIDTFAIARSFLKKSGDLVIDITGVDLTYVDANLDTDAEGTFKLLRAFEPKEVETKGPSSSRATVTHLRKIKLRHGWVHGQPKGAPHVDADLDRLDLSLIVGGAKTAADLATLEVTARSLPEGLDLRTHIEAHYNEPAPSGTERAARANLKGDVRGVPFTLNGTMDGPEVAADFDVPELTPEAATRLASALELTAPLVAHAEVRGRLPDLRAALHVGAGAGALDVEATATIAEEKKVRATLRARKIDAHALSRGAPKSNVSADALVAFEQDASGDGRGTFSLDVPSGDVAGNLVPTTRVAGKIALSGASEESTALHVEADGDIEEPGARTKLHASFDQRGDASDVAFQLNTALPKLDRTRFGNLVSGSAALDVRGHVILAPTMIVDASVSLDASRVVQSDVRIARATLTAKVQGALAPPTAANLDVQLWSRGVAAGGMTFSDANFRVRGTRRAAEVTATLVPTDGPHVDVSTWVSLDEEPALRNAQVTVARDDVRADLRVVTARFAGPDVRVEGVTLEGLGDTLRADLTKTSRSLEIRAATDGLDLAKIGTLLHQPDFKGGRVALDVDMNVRSASAKGHARAELTDGTIGRVKNGKASIEAKFAGREIDAQVHAKLGDVGDLDVDDFHVAIDGNAPLGAAALEKARGKVALDAKLDIGRLKAILPRGTLPFTDMQGALRLKGEIARETVQDAPALSVAVATRGLVLSGRGDPEDRERVGQTRIDPTPPWNIEGVDVEFTAGVAKEDGKTTLLGKIFDRQGTIVSVDAKTEAMPYRQWLKTKTIDPSKLSSLEWTADVAVPEREFKKFPAIFKTRQMGGSLGASFHFGGSLADPDLRVLVEAKEWVTPVPKGMQPINAKVDAHYQKEEGAADINVASRERELLTGNVQMRGALPGLERPGAEATPWTASTKMHIAEFPLETLGAFSDLQIKGFLSGDVEVSDVHSDARAKVRLAMRDLKLGRARFPRGNANVDFDGHRLKSGVRLEQTDGFADVQAEVAMRWGAETTPTVVTEEPAFAVLKASQFRAAAITPFAGGAVSDLDGRIYADARIDLVPHGAPKLQGKIALDRGKLQLARLGEPLRDVNLHVTLAPDGVIRLDDLKAQGTTGRINAKGVVRMNGFQLSGARASIRIPKNDPFPVDIDGQAIGDVDASIDVTADVTPDQRTLNVKIDIPTLHTQLPLASSNKPQELGEADKIRVGYFRRTRQFVILPKDAEDLEEKEPPPADEESTKMVVAIHLGNDVEIRKGKTLKIAVTGNPKIDLSGEEPKMSGQLQLTRGMLEIQGRRFEIERGLVTFVGEADNPQIVVTAGWTAPDGTRVYADFVGPLKTGKVKLRSEPSRPQNEILALVMFGAVEGSSSTPYPQRQPNGATRAGVMAGGFATEGLSKGIDELTGLDVSAKIDTSNSANPKPEVEVQIARDISVQIAYVIGTPPPGMNPDRTFFTLDWRFRRNWSMETTFGDQGSSILDLLWQYRY